MMAAMTQMYLSKANMTKSCLDSSFSTQTHVGMSPEDHHSQLSRSPSPITESSVQKTNYISFTYIWIVAGSYKYFYGKSDKCKSLRCLPLTAPPPLPVTILRVSRTNSVPSQSSLIILCLSYDGIIFYISDINLSKNKCFITNIVNQLVQLFQRERERECIYIYSLQKRNVMLIVG